MLNVALLPLHIVCVPLITPVGRGFTVIALVCGALDPHILFAVALTLPEVLANVTVMEVVPCPKVIEAPLGTLHV